MTADAAACTYKARYVTQREARHALRQMRQHESAGKVHAYSCGACGYWHLGNRNTKRLLKRNVLTTANGVVELAAAMGVEA